MAGASDRPRTDVCLCEACRSVEDIRRSAYPWAWKGSGWSSRASATSAITPAKFCREQGAIIVGLAEREGAIYNPKG